LAITITNTSGSINSDEMMLIKVNEAIQAIPLGKSYSITGSRAFTNYDVDDLLKIKDYYEDRVLAAKGGIGANVSDFNDTCGSSAAQGG